jgi:hypothetical protein
MVHEVYRISHLLASNRCETISLRSYFQSEVTAFCQAE